MQDDLRKTFYLNPRGSSVLELVLVTVAIPCLFLALSPSGPDARLSPAVSLLHRTLVAATVTLVLMPPSPTVQGLIIGLCISAGLLRFLSADPHAPSSISRDRATRHTYISSAKSALLVYTACAILAVDFPAFPRRYAKTTAIGNGLMDLGVGLYVASFGGSSREARAESLLASPSNGTRSYLQQLMGAVKRSAVLLLLGLGRALAVKSTGYHEQVGEYGAHWNFFLTLSALSLLTAALGPLAQGPYAAFSGLAILLLHEGRLLGCGTSELYRWILSDAPSDRPADLRSLSDLIGLNKEGILSLPGYLSLYLLATAVFRVVNQACYGLESRLARRREDAGTGPIIALDLALWALYAFLDSSISRTSRRACNAAFVVWVLAHALFLSLIPLVASTRGLRAGEIEEGLARYMLPIFLMCNILTGLTNLSLDTIRTPVPWSWLIVGGYCFTFVSVPRLKSLLGRRF